MTKRGWIIIGGVVALVVAQRVFLPLFTIPQNGMYPTYSTRTTVLASGYLSAPSSLARGDVVVYREHRSDADYDFIWRVIGLPGETVEVRDDVVFIDGAPIAQTAESVKGAMSIRREQAGDRSYEVAFPTTGDESKASNAPPIAVPAGSVFLLGDNRHNAHDSRATGPIPIRSVRARVLATLVSGSP